MLLALVDANRRSLSLLQLALHHLLWVTWQTRLFGFTNPVLESDLIEAAFAAETRAVDLQVIVVDQHLFLMVVTELACAAHLEAHSSATTCPNYVRGAFVHDASNFWQSHAVMVVLYN